MHESQTHKLNLNNELFTVDFN